ncbi:hypothetical protein LXL04_002311 [Taraxacum kok-saghyz]
MPAVELVNDGQRRSKVGQDPPRRPNRSKKVTFQISILGGDLILPTFSCSRFSSKSIFSLDIPHRRLLLIPSCFRPPKPSATTCAPQPSLYGLRSTTTTTPAFLHRISIDLNPHWIVRVSIEYRQALSPQVAFQSTGAGILIMQKFDIVPFLELIQKYKVTIGPFVPPIVLAIAKNEEVVDKFDIVPFLQVLLFCLFVLNSEEADEEMYQERSVLQVEEDEEEDLNRIKEEKDTGAKVNDGQGELSDSNIGDTPFSVGRAPLQNGVERALGTGGLGEGTPKSERSNDDDIFGDSSPQAQKERRNDMFSDRLLEYLSNCYDLWTYG